MKKTLLKSILFGALVTSFNLTFGQIDGTTNIAPNYQGYDINGDYHDIYADYLDNNIPVILDVSAHWCNPCWVYHNTHALKDLYDQYGPNGTISPNKAMVLWADGDANSTFPLLYGAPGSQGDWVTGTPFPIFGGDTGVGANAGRDLATLYQINYFPTIFIIHPDRTVEELTQPGLNTLINAINNANPPASNSDDLNLTYGYPLSSVCPGESLSFDFIMKNQGTETITSAQIDAEVNGSVIYSHNWTGNLETYHLSEENITFDLNGVANGEQDLELVVKTVNGNADADASNNVIARTLNLKETSNSNYKLTIKTDNAANETNWFIRNDLDEIIFRRDDFNGGAYSNNTLYEHDITLNNPSCYKLLVTDSDGDGMTSGYIVLKDASFQTIGSFTVSGYESEISWESTVVPSSVSEKTINNSVKTYPNPIRDVVNLELNLPTNANVSIQLVNLLGEVISSNKLGNMVGVNTTQINTKDLSKGAYILNINIDGEILTEKIIK